MAFFERAIAALNDAKVRYVVVGGVAVVLHGYVRLTMDLDLVVDLARPEAERAVRVLVGLGLRPLVPVDPLSFADAQTRASWIEQRNMLVFSLQNPDDPREIVDLFVRSPIDFEELMAHAQVVAIAGTTARIASVDHLLQMKREAGRPKDMLDIAELEAKRRAMGDG